MEKEEILREYILNELSESVDYFNNELTEDNTKLNYRFPFISLKKDLDNFLSGNTENRSIILPGLRGIGKTTIILQLCDYLINEKNIDFRRILYLDASELKNYLDVGIYEAITYFITEIHHETLRTIKKPFFIFVDEAQNDEKWAIAGKLLYDKIKNDKIFLVFTGSSALNIELNADLARRAKKEQICPMDFGEYLYLKYGVEFPENMKNALKKLIFYGNINESSQIEKNIELSCLGKLEGILKKEWEYYLLYGEFPYGIKKNTMDIKKFNFQIINKIIQNDLNTIESFTSRTTNIASNLLSLLALQKPGNISQNKLASSLNTSVGTINSILYTLEKTHLIFHIEPYSSAGKRIRKSWKYYFLSPNLKYSLISKVGNVSRDRKNCLGILTENLVVSRLLTYKKSKFIDFGIFYPTEKEGVDFIINTIEGKIIPIEVGIGKKSKRQIKKAITKYKSDYGIVISNTTNNIVKEEDIIYLPLDTFSFI